VSQDIIILPVEELGRDVSPAAVETALIRTRGIRAVSMNVSAGRIRVAFDPDQTRLRDIAAVICAAGCGLRVSQTMVRARGGDYPWCNAKVATVLRQITGVVDAVWDRTTEFVVVSYLPSLVRTRALVAAVLAAGYRLADDPLSAPEVSAVYVATKVAVSLNPTVAVR
jgi:copper chaperone CopZ